MPKPTKPEKPLSIIIHGVPDLIRRIDDWRRTRPEIPPRSAASKELLDAALTAAGFPPKETEEPEEPEEVETPETSLSTFQ